MTVILTIPYTMALAGRVLSWKNKILGRESKIQVPSDFHERYDAFVKAHAEYEDVLSKFEESLSEDQSRMMTELKSKANAAHFAYQRFEYKAQEALHQENP